MKEIVEDTTLLESLVQAGESRSDSTESPISPDAVLGNIFVFIMAGYKTSSSTLTYALILLACRPDIQQQLQVDLDRIFGDRTSDQFSYDTDLTKLLDGYVGAIFNETLRLYAPLPFIPKATQETPKPITIGSQVYSVPANTLCLMNTIATHRNPKYWPESKHTSADGPPYPVSNFEPSRWLSGQPGGDSAPKGALFSPKPGSYLPFSEGYRSCIGKRFAQVQFCSAMAGIFKEFSVELGVDKEDGAAWAQAKAHAEFELSTGMTFDMSLHMSGEVPLRFVKRS